MRKLGVVTTRIQDSSLLLQGTSQGTGQEAIEMFWKQHNYALAGNDPPYELKDTKDVNKIDIANDIYDHNDDVQHTAKAGGGARIMKPEFGRKVERITVYALINIKYLH